ncbi:DUF3040 domain-containing protein [Streptomonospora salina]|uniref:DUF3040 domain-containing protein n=1 Tax=Streptomonospora salina TaxID=104205 RepID=A0A841EDB7_9ACTN|nr:DUF3040 domain-containing protein [Streptomonospora salina]MBB6001115.1 hypothetical protein [Streptomonospora salina]
MSLRENERRILAEIEQALAEDDPDLDEHLKGFGIDDPSDDEEDRPGRGVLLLLIGAGALVLCALLAGIYFSAPVQGTEPAAPASSPAGQGVPGAGGG